MNDKFRAQGLAPLRLVVINQYSSVKENCRRGTARIKLSLEEKILDVPYTVYHRSVTELYWVINGGGIRAEGATNSGRKALRPYDWWLSRNGWEIRVGAQLIW